MNKKLLNNLLHKNNNFKILSLILFLIFFNYQKLHSLENKILLKIDNDIITTYIYEEIKFLKLFNPQLNNLVKIDI